MTRPSALQPGRRTTWSGPTTPRRRSASSTTAQPPTAFSISIDQVAAAVKNPWVHPSARVLGHEQKHERQGVPRCATTSASSQSSEADGPPLSRPDLVRLRALAGTPWIASHRRRIPQGTAVERRPALQPLRPKRRNALLQVRQRRGTDRGREHRPSSKPTDAPLAAPLLRPGAGRRLRGRHRRGRRTPQVLDAPDSLVVRRLRQIPRPNAEEHQQLRPKEFFHR